jgi:hypothetical protein
MRIKLTDDQAKVWRRINCQRGELSILLASIGEDVRQQFESLKKIHSGYNFEAANIDHETNELILPYQTDEER